MGLKKRKKSAAKSGISGMLWHFSGSVVQILSQFIVIGILSRLLTPEEFGVVGVIFVLVNFTSLFTNMGIATAIIQLKTISSKHLSLGYSMSLIIGILVGLLFYFIAPSVASFFNLNNADNAIRFFAIFFPLRSFNSVTSAILARDLRFSLIVKCGAMSYIFGIGLTSIVLAYLDFGYWALIIGQFSGVLVTVGLMMYYSPPTFSFRFEKKITSELLLFGSGHTLGHIFNYFGDNADKIIVGKSLGVVSMGIYTKAFQLFGIPTRFFGGIYDNVFFPILAKNQDKKEKLSSFYLLSTSFCFGVLFPLATILFVNAELIVKIMLGDQWGMVTFPFQILIFGMAYRFGTRINKSYLKSLGIIYKGAYYQFVFAVLMFTFCLIGGYFFELPGIASGVFIATFLNYLQMSYRLYNELNFAKMYFLQLHLKTLILYVPFFIATMILYKLGIKDAWIHLCLSIFIYLPLFVVFITSKKNIVFNDVNAPMLTQIFNSLPPGAQNNFKKISFLKNYFVKS